MHLFGIDAMGLEDDLAGVLAHDFDTRSLVRAATDEERGVGVRYRKRDRCQCALRAIASIFIRANPVLAREATCLAVETRGHGVAHDRLAIEGVASSGPVAEIALFQIEIQDPAVGALGWITISGLGCCRHDGTGS